MSGSSKSFVTSYGEFEYHTGTGAWSFAPNSEINALNTGDTVPLVFTVTASSQTKAAVKTLTINLIGTEDRAKLTVTAADADPDQNPNTFYLRSIPMQNEVIIIATFEVEDPDTSSYEVGDFTITGDPQNRFEVVAGDSTGTFVLRIKANQAFIISEGNVEIDVTLNGSGLPAQHFTILTDVEDVGPSFLPDTVTSSPSTHIYETWINRLEGEKHAYMSSVDLARNPTRPGAEGTGEITITLLREGGPIEITGEVSGWQTTTDTIKTNVWAIRNGSTWSLIGDNDSNDVPEADEAVFLFAAANTFGGTFALSNGRPDKVPDGRVYELYTVRITDTAADDTYANPSGLFGAKDPDSAISYTVALDGTLAGENTHRERFTHKIDTDYGNLWINATSGAWEFVVNDSAVEALGNGDTPSLDFTVTAHSNNKTAIKTLSIDLTGAADTPELMLTMGAADTDRNPTTYELDASPTPSEATVIAWVIVTDSDTTYQASDFTITGDPQNRFEVVAGHEAGIFYLRVKGEKTFDPANNLSLNITLTGDGNPSVPITIFTDISDNAPEFLPFPTELTALEEIFVYRSKTELDFNAPNHFFRSSVDLGDIGARYINEGPRPGAGEEITITLLRDQAGGGAVDITDEISGLSATGDGKDTHIWAVRHDFVWTLQAVSNEVSTPSGDEAVFLFTLTENGGETYQLSSTARVSDGNIIFYSSTDVIVEIVDTAALDSFSPVAPGNYRATDADGDTITYSLSYTHNDGGGVAGASNNDLLRIDDEYILFELGKAWAYHPKADAINALGDGESASIEFTITATANGKATARTVTFLITGADDTARTSVTAGDADADNNPNTFTLTEANSFEAIDVATITVSDPDTNYTQGSFTLSDDRFEIIPGTPDQSFELRVKAYSEFDPDDGNAEVDVTVGGVTETFIINTASATKVVELEVADSSGVDAHDVLSGHFSATDPGSHGSSVPSYDVTLNAPTGVTYVQTVTQGVKTFTTDYGVFSFVPTANSTADIWRFASSTGIDALDAGEVISLDFTVTATSLSAVSTYILRLNLTGAEDDPVLTVTTEGPDGDLNPNTFELERIPINTTADMATITVTDVDTASYEAGDFSVSDSRFEIVAGSTAGTFTLRIKPNRVFDAAENVNVDVSLGGVTERFTVWTDMADHTPEILPVRSQLSASDTFHVYQSGLSLSPSAATHKFISSVDLGVVTANTQNIQPVDRNPAPPPGAVGTGEITITLLRDSGAVHITGEIAGLTEAAQSTTAHYIWAVYDGTTWSLQSPHPHSSLPSVPGGENVFLYSVLYLNDEYLLTGTTRLADGTTHELNSGELVIVDIADTAADDDFSDPAAYPGLSGSFLATDQDLADADTAISYDVRLADGTAASVALGADDPLSMRDKYTHKVVTEYGTLWFKENNVAPTYGQKIKEVTYPGSAYLYQSDENPSDSSNTSRHYFTSSVELGTIAGPQGASIPNDNNNGPRPGAVGTGNITITLLRDSGRQDTGGNRIYTEETIIDEISGLPATGGQDAYHIWAVRNGEDWSLEAVRTSSLTQYTAPSGDEHVFLYTIRGILPGGPSALSSAYHLFSSTEIEGSTTFNIEVQELVEHGGRWEFEADNSAVQGLGHGQEATVDFTVTANSGGKAAAQRLIVHLTGAEDEPVLELAPHDIADTVRRDDFDNLTGSFGARDYDDNDDDITYEVTLGSASVETVSNVTGFEGFTRKITASHNGKTYGALYFNPADGDWEFDIVDDAVNALGDGVVIPFEFKVKATSMGLESTEETLAISISGIDDNPAVIVEAGNRAPDEDRNPFTYALDTAHITVDDKNIAIFYVDDPDTTYTQNDFVLSGADTSKFHIQEDALLDAKYYLFFKNGATFDFAADGDVALRVTFSGQEFDFDIFTNTSDSAPVFGLTPSEVTASADVYIYQSNMTKSPGSPTHRFISNVDLSTLAGQGPQSEGNRPGVVGTGEITFTLLRDESAGGAVHFSGEINGLPANGNEDSYDIWAYKQPQGEWKLLAGDPENISIAFTPGTKTFLYTVRQTGGSNDPNFELLNTTRAQDGKTFEQNPDNTYRTGSFSFTSKEIVLKEDFDTSANDDFPNPTGSFTATDSDNNDTDITYTVTLENGTATQEAVLPDDADTVRRGRFTDKITTDYGVLWFHRGDGAASGHGDWEFIVNDDAVNRLDAGDFISLDFSVAAASGGGVIRQVLKFNFTGADDNPVMTLDPVFINDTLVDDDFNDPPPSGNFGATDPEGDAVSYSVSYSSSPAVRPAGSDPTALKAIYSHKIATAYGTLWLNDGSTLSDPDYYGEWIFDANEDLVNALDAGERILLEFTVVARSGLNTTTQTLNLIITGTNDLALLAVEPDGGTEVIKTTEEDNTSKTISGVVGFSDADDTNATIAIKAGHSHGADPATPANSGLPSITTGAANIVSGHYGFFTIARNDTSGELDWTYKLANAGVEQAGVTGLAAMKGRVQALAGGEQVVEKLTIYAGSNPSPVTVDVNITGVDDALVLFVGRSQHSSGVFFITEDQTAPVQNLVRFSDVDQATADIVFNVGHSHGTDPNTLLRDDPGMVSVTASSPPVIVGQYGVFTFTRNDDTGRVDWTYQLAHANAVLQGVDPADAAAMAARVQSMRDGRTVAERLTIYVGDDESMDPSIVEVAIRGVNDLPELATTTENSTGAIEEDNTTKVVQGGIPFNDVDEDNSNEDIVFNIGHSHGANPATLAANDTSLVATTSDNRTPADIAGHYGIFSFSRDDSTSELSWTYKLANAGTSSADGFTDAMKAQVQALARGQQVVEKLTIYADDEHAGGTTARTVTVTITGVNDLPELNGTTTVAKRLTEDVDGSRGGVFSFGDVDNPAADVVFKTGLSHGTDPATLMSDDSTLASTTPTLTTPADIVGEYGVVSFTRNDGSLMLNWTYHLANADATQAGITDAMKARVQALTGGQQVSEKLTVYASDAYGINDIPVTALVTVTGADDLRVLTTAAGHDTGAITEDDSSTEVNGQIGFDDPDDANTGVVFKIGHSHGTAPATLTANAAGLSTATTTGTTTPADVIGHYGIFTFTRDDASGTLTWNYHLANAGTSSADGFTDAMKARVQGLAGSQQVADKLTIYATDQLGALPHPATVTVTVTGADDVAVVSSTQVASAVIETTSTAETDIATISVSDVDTTYQASDFSVDDIRFDVVAGSSSNEFVLKLLEAKSFDFETETNPFTVTVAASTGALHSTNFSQDFTITITDIDDTDPVVTRTASTHTLAETNSTTATDIATITVTDPDTTYAANVFTVSDNRFGVVASGTDNVFTFKLLGGKSFDYETETNPFTVTVAASTGALHSTNFSQDFTITITDIDDTAASVSHTPDRISLAETTSTAETDLGTITVTDPDTTYAVGDFTVTGDDRFEFVAADGVRNVFKLRVKAGQSFDYDPPANETEFTVTVAASATGGLQSTNYSQDFTIAITDINDATHTLSASQSTYYLEQTDESDEIEMAILTISDTNAVYRASDITISGDPQMRFGIEAVQGEENKFTLNVLERQAFFPDGDDRFTDLPLTIGVGGVEKAFTVKITEYRPQLGLDLYVGVNENEPLVLSWIQIEGIDDDTADANLVYTVSEIDAVRFERNVDPAANSGAGRWVNIDLPAFGPREITFTEAEINQGRISLVTDVEGSFKITLSDGVSTTGMKYADGVTTIVPKHVQVLIRDPYDLPPSVENLDDVNTNAENGASGSGGVQGAQGAQGTQGNAYVGEERPWRVETGFGDTVIMPGPGDDEIAAGIGDDVIDLSMGGTDEVTYSYAVADANNYISWDGGDLVTGFTPGRDSILFSNRSGSPSAAPDALRAEFLSKLGTSYLALLGIEHNGEASNSSLADYDVVQVYVAFPVGVTLPSGRYTGGGIKVEFIDPIPWTEFKPEWLAGDAVDESTLLFKGNADGQAALQKLINLKVEADTSPRIWLGSEGDDTITVTDGSGGWVIHAKGGDDEVRFGDGADEFVYVFSHIRDISNPDADVVRFNDGSDTIRNFTLGEDRLCFVDDHVDPANTVTTEANVAHLLRHLREPSSGAELTYDGSAYTGITFDLVDETLTVEFSSGLDADALKARFGGDTGSLTDYLLGQALVGGIPTGAGQVALNVWGIGFIDELFAGDGDFEGLEVSGTLPDELL
ncbi:MAG: VCBS domain-containing protein [Parvularculales bacterium]